MSKFSDNRRTKVVRLLKRKEENLKELEKKLGNLEELPKELKTLAILDFLEKIMDFYDLDWRDFTRALIGKNCLLCKSRIRKDSKGHAVSVGHRFCLICGESLEKIEIEPSYSKA